MGAMLTPGFGAPLVERIAAADHVASLGAMIADAPSGRVLGASRPVPVYRLARHDAARLIEAIGAITRIHLAAGAEEVELGGGAPPVSSPGEIDSALSQVRPSTTPPGCLSPDWHRGSRGQRRPPPGRT